MNIYISKGRDLGSTNIYLAISELKLAAELLDINIIDDADLATIIIILGSGGSVDSTLFGKKVYTVANIDDVFTTPEQILLQAQTDAVFYANPTEIKNDANKPLDAKRVIGVTACLTGIANTFVAADAIQEQAKKRGYWCKVESRSSIGVINELTTEDIASADLVIAACDIDVDLSKFYGKKLYRTKTRTVIKKPDEEWDNAFKEDKLFGRGAGYTPSYKEKRDHYRDLLTGVSYMLPMVVAGGLLIALSYFFGSFQDVLRDGVWVKEIVGEPHLTTIGNLAFSLMVPMLSGYISYSIADRSGLASGFVGGLLAVSAGAGFLGGIIIGYIAGYVSLLLNHYIKLPKSLLPLKPILFIPLLSTLFTGLTMQFIIGPPIAWLMVQLTSYLHLMNTTNSLVFGAILGGMMCADMGGPINKVAYAFATSLITSQEYAPMAAVMAGGMVSPLAMSLSTFVARKKFTTSEKESGKVAFILGLCFITQGAVPFAARDPFRVIPCCILGGALAGGMSLALGTQLMTPHGGLFALLIPDAVTHVLGYLLAIIAGTVTAGVLYAMIKKKDANVS